MGRGRLTDISDQIRRDDPAAALKLMQVVGDGHQSGTDNGNFKIDEEEAKVEAVYMSTTGIASTLNFALNN